MPDRVIDAPIPAHLLRIGSDVHYPDVCECDLVGLEGECKIQPPLELVGDWIKRLIAIVARLEADKQDAHTEGWNAAIEAAVEEVVSQRPMQYEEIIRNWDDKDYSGYARACMRIEAGIRALSKPTAAKQGDPS